MSELKPCPFCGGGESRVDEFKLWTGKRHEITSVSVKHWCPVNPVSGGGWRTYMQFQGKTRDQAISAWNHRSE